MNKISRTITGIIIITLGIYISYASFLDLAKDWPGLIFGVVFIIIGLFILFNEKEDDIEKIKNTKLKN
ncbi:MAG: hypothetical protein ABIH48_02855 [Candidatus Falkowbacteria bacterium]